MPNENKIIKDAECVLSIVSYLFVTIICGGFLLLTIKLIAFSKLLFIFLSTATAFLFFFCFAMVFANFFILFKLKNGRYTVKIKKIDKIKTPLGFYGANGKKLIIDDEQKNFLINIEIANQLKIGDEVVCVFLDRYDSPLLVYKEDELLKPIF